MSSNLALFLIRFGLVFMLIHGAGCCTKPILKSDHGGLSFNGKDLTGFYHWLRESGYRDPNQVFSVTNRMLRISGEGFGYLATVDEFSNFVLRVEFRWGEKNWKERIGKARDSGVFFHATGPDGNSEDGQGAFMAAFECQIMEGAVGDFLLIRGKAKDQSVIWPRLTTRVASARDADGWFYWKKQGQPQTVERWGRINAKGKNPQWRDEFNFDSNGKKHSWIKLEIIFSAGAVTVKRNGQIVNEAFDLAPRKGKILLQCEGSEIFFRKFEIQPL